MKPLLIPFLCLILFSCSQKQENNLAVSQNDKDTTSNLQKNPAIQTNGKQEDFDEFFEKITWDNSFLISRTQFPIEINGKIKKDKSEWKGMSFFKDEEFYTQLSYDTSGRNLVLNKDEIHLNIIHLKNKRSSRLSFKNTHSKWFLVKVETVSISKLADYDFLIFLRKYSIDSVYQINQTIYPFIYQSTEIDNYDSLITDLIERDSAAFWNVLENFNNLVFVEEEYKASDMRNIFFHGRDNGIWVQYYFIKNKKGWFHWKSEDYSI